MNWQDTVVLIIVLAAAIFFIIRMARSFRHEDACPSCRHSKDNNATNGTNPNRNGANACAGCPLRDSCHKV